MLYNLSEITDVIRSRRTIYPEQFSSRIVQKDQIELILNNAIWAPTHQKNSAMAICGFSRPGKTEFE